MIFFVTALDCEAKPLIKAFQMKLMGGHGRAQFFGGDDVALVVTGVGSMRSAIGTTALGMSLASATNSVWLNVGICGHGKLDLGEAVIATKISSSTTGESIYPQCPWTVPWKGSHVKTLHCPSNEYEYGVAFDMEAYGFYEAALRFSPSECIQSIKIVSDNQHHPADRKFDKNRISELIERHIDDIVSCSKTAAQFSKIYKSPRWIDAIVEEATKNQGFTATQRIQLQKKLGQWSRLSEEEEPKTIRDLIDNAASKKEILSRLEDEIQGLAEKKLG